MVELELATPKLREHIETHYFDTVKLNALIEIWRKFHLYSPADYAKEPGTKNAKLLLAVGTINRLLYDVVDQVKKLNQIKKDNRAAKELGLKSEAKDYALAWEEQFKIVDKMLEELKNTILQNDSLRRGIFPDIAPPRLSGVTKKTLALVSFADPEVQNFWSTVDAGDPKIQSKAQSMVKQAKWARYAGLAMEKLDQLNSCTSFALLKQTFGSGLDHYKVTVANEYAGYFKLRIDSQFRIFFQYSEGSARNITIIDHHND